MPNYDDLRATFDEAVELRDLAREAARISIVHGFTLDLDPAWYFAMMAEEDEFVRRLLYDFIELRRFRYRLNSFREQQFVCQMLRDLNGSGYRRLDLQREPMLWDEFADILGRPAKRRPILLTIVHRPTPTPVVGGDSAIEAEELSRLRELVRGSEAYARIEERPLARLAFAAGDKIATSAGKFGTYGGTLFDPNGNPVGMTCAHVASPGDSISDAGGVAIGSCIHSSMLASLPGTGVCDPVSLKMPSPSPGNGPDLNMLDCALIELTKSPTPLKLGGVAASLCPGQSVTIHGASRQIRCTLGSLALSYNFVHGGQYHCFRDSIELIPHSGFPIGGAIGQFFAPLPVAGDSGAWVLTDDQPPVWAALFFAEDGTRGFGIRASWAHKWAEASVGKKLSV